MRARRLAAAVGLGALAVATLAQAQPPSGVVRPDNEGSKSLQELGSELYAGNCASCHGIGGRGIGESGPQRGAGAIQGQGPSLRGVGAQAVDFYLRTGLMPLGNIHEEPYRRRPVFSNREIQALVTYVSSLAPGPPIPHPDPASGNLAEGLHLFTEHCAGCHQVVAEGGYVTDARVPLIEEDTSVQIAEAVRIGPYLMPTFSKKDISDAQLNSIIAYLERSKRPADRGGWSIGHIGPVAEGIVTWLIAAVVLVAMCVLIGTRLRS